MAIDYEATIEALEEALSSGTLSVSINGRTVTYKSTSEILAAIQFFQGRQNKAAGKTVFDKMGKTLLKG